MQDIFQPDDYPDLLVGLSSPDDAAVWRLDDKRSLVVTIDFFTPVVDDPYDYGAIAAANALSDLYAMGAYPILTLNVAAMPGSLPADIVSEIFRGGAEKVREAGAVVAGGHTIQDDEPKFGLVGVGLIETDNLLTKAGAEVGDILVLTKPLGTGVTTTALRGGTALEEDISQAVAWMKRLNEAALTLALTVGVNAATDVTGFSLLGHALEMAEASGVGFRLYLPSIPFLGGARKYAEAANFPGGSIENKMYFSDRVQFDETIDENNQLLLFDAQTSGGLLIAVPEKNLGAFLEQAVSKSVPVWLIGSVEEGEGIRVKDRPFEGETPEFDDLGKLWFSS
ncbi:MAG: selenide, water dikinase SelD [Anaerolineales bacterium]|nr:selenide, water dikinase SelD [Anaerolineales bacterium]